MQAEDEERWLAEVVEDFATNPIPYYSRVVRAYCTAWLETQNPRFLHQAAEMQSYIDELKEQRP